MKVQVRQLRTLSLGAYENLFVCQRKSGSCYHSWGAPQTYTDAGDRQTDIQAALSEPVTDTRGHHFDASAWWMLRYQQFIVAWSEEWQRVCMLRKVMSGWGTGKSSGKCPWSEAWWPLTFILLMESQISFTAVRISFDIFSLYKARLTSQHAQRACSGSISQLECTLFS